MCELKQQFIRFFITFSVLNDKYLHKCFTQNGVVTQDIEMYLLQRSLVQEIECLLEILMVQQNLRGNTKLWLIEQRTAKLILVVASS